MPVYRLSSSRYLALDGLGASLYGGRWNHKGTPVIYSASSRALCAIEILANAEGLAGDYVITPIEIPEDVRIEALSVEHLPKDWFTAAGLNITREIGTKWAADLKTDVLRLPSAVIPREDNFILNPRHIDFARLAVLEPEAFTFDDRLKRAKWPQ